MIYKIYDLASNLFFYFPNISKNRKDSITIGKSDLEKKLIEATSNSENSHKIFPYISQETHKLYFYYF